MSIPVTGFVDQNGAIRKYDYSSLENVPADLVKDADLDAVIAVQDTEPEDDKTKLWIKETSESAVQVPTYDEFLDSIVVARGTGTNSLIEVHTTTPNIASESSSVAIGGGNQSTASGAVAIGTNNIASAQNAIAIGSKLAGADPNTASAPAATALGLSCTASGYGSVAMGYNTTSSGTGSTSMGYQTSATLDGALASGYLSTASGIASTAIGYQSTSSGTASAAIGREATASGYASTALGRGTTASASQSFATGRDTKAEAIASTALGYGTDATGARSLVAGAYNEPDANEVDTTHGSGARKYLMIIGNGTADTARSNAATLDWDGNAVFAGKATVGAAPTADMDVATKKYVDDAVARIESLINSITMSYAEKQALLACFRKVAWIDNQGQSYYNALESELFPDATLESITAVFTQGSAVIYDTDSLDTLRQYLVVTANFSDSTTETITNYTLFGTLASGTSTITASYGGKTDTFGVSVESATIFEWDYTDGTDNIILDGNGTAELQNDGVYLAGGSSAWSQGRIRPDITPFSASSGSYKITVDYTDLYSNASNSASSFFIYNSDYPGTKILRQTTTPTSGVNITRVNSGAGTSSDLNWQLSDAGTLIIEYHSETHNVKFIQGSYEATVQAASSTGTAAVANAQAGDRATRTAHVKIQHIRIEWIH